MREDAGLKEYLDRTTFINKDGEVCEFTDLQKHDLNLVLQKRYALLNWQQGSGKTAAVYHRAKYLLKFRKAKNVIILAPAIATNMTWIPFLTINKERFPYNTDAGDLNNIPEGTFLVVSTSMLRKLKRGLMRFVKRTSGKLCLVFDESTKSPIPHRSVQETSCAYSGGSGTRSSTREQPPATTSRNCTANSSCCIITPSIWFAGVTGYTTRTGTGR